MKVSFKLKTLRHEAGKKCCPGFLNCEQAEKIRRYHTTFLMYEPTPLVCLTDTAAMLGLGSVYVKDESRRFGLNAFKVRDGSYAIGHELADRLEKRMEEIDCGLLISTETREQLGDITFVTATDGNHGRGHCGILCIRVWGGSSESSNCRA